MKTVDFTQHLLSIQTELFRFAFKLTADREEAIIGAREVGKQLLKALEPNEPLESGTVPYI